MYVFECRAEYRTDSSIFKVCMVLNAELNFERVARYSKCVLFRMQSWMSNPHLDIQITYYFKCRTERGSHSSIFKMYVFECRTECRTHSSIFKVCIILNAELNIDPTARNSRWMFSNEELNVEPIVRYSNFYGFECRAEFWTNSSIFKVYIVSNAELNVDLIAWYSGWIFSNAELNVEPMAPYSNCVLFWMQSWTWISQLDIQDVCFRM